MMRSGRPALLAALVCCLPHPARAAVGMSMTLLNSDFFRGRSLSRGRPVAIAQLSYDDLSGFYVGGSMTGVAARHSGPELLGVEGYAGYAFRLKSGPTIDAGITHTRYTHWYSGERTVDYTEFYAGIVTSHISSHLRYSPDYLGTGQSTLYGDIDGVLRPADKWRLTAHAGLYFHLSGPILPPARQARFDWQIGASREIGRFNVQLSWAGAAPGWNYYGGRPHHSSALLLGASYIF